VKAIAVGETHVCALTTAGGVVCWGDNTDGALGDGTTTTRTVPVQVSGLSSGVIAIAAGGTSGVDWGQTCALTTGGGVLCWGANDFGQVGNNSLTNSLTPVPVSGASSGIVSISAGEHTCALTTAGRVVCWGPNYDGQLGNGSTTSTTFVGMTPVEPAPVSVVEP
jgi:hypothetical protein